jgi:hypothetical protein
MREAAEGMREGMERNPARNDKGKISKNQQK